MRVVFKTPFLLCLRLYFATRIHLSYKETKAKKAHNVPTHLIDKCRQNHKTKNILMYQIIKKNQLMLFTFLVLILYLDSDKSYLYKKRLQTKYSVIDYTRLV